MGLNRNNIKTAVTNMTAHVVIRFQSFSEAFESYCILLKTGSLDNAIRDFHWLSHHGI